MLKIDAFAHIFTKEYGKRLMSLAPAVSKTFEFRRPSMTDIAIREDVMRRHPDILQIVTMGNVPLWRYVSVQDAIELSRIGNDEMAELVKTKPSLFYGAVGTIPIDDVDASLKEIDYCINNLGLLGIQLYTTLERESLAEPKYRPIYELMAQLDRPIWIHPTADLSKPGYDKGMFSWLYESSRYMLDVVNAGLFKDFPDLKFIIHHAGGMVPHCRERVRCIMPKHEDRYFRNFYVDTALYGNAPGLMSAFDYYGADHMLFGTDAPLGGIAGSGCHGNTDQTIIAIDKMDISDEDREKIYHGNAVRLFVVPA